jgi:hypothetical protein
MLSGRGSDRGCDGAAIVITVRQEPSDFRANFGDRLRIAMPLKRKSCRAVGQWIRRKPDVDYSGRVPCGAARHYSPINPSDEISMTISTAPRIIGAPFQPASLALSLRQPLIIPSYRTT